MHNTVNTGCASDATAARKETRLTPCHCAARSFPHRADVRCTERAELDTIEHEQDRDYARDIASQHAREWAAERRQVAREYGRQ